MAVTYGIIMINLNLVLFDLNDTTLRDSQNEKSIILDSFSKAIYQMD